MYLICIFENAKIDSMKNRRFLDYISRKRAENRYIKVFRHGKFDGDVSFEVAVTHVCVYLTCLIYLILTHVCFLDCVSKERAEFRYL